MKDQWSKKILLQGQLDRVLYEISAETRSPNINPQPSSPVRVYLHQNKDSKLWHIWLGHPSRKPKVLSQVLPNCNLQVANSSYLDSCTSCQLAKSHRLL